MTEHQKLPAPRFDLPHKGPHPFFLVAAASVAAVALIAAAQMLRPSNASSASKDVSVPVAVSTKAPLRGAAAACPSCGVVVAVRETKQVGEGTGVGAVAGGVVGGVVGHQFGGGRGKDAMTVAGAVGGAVAGHQVEKQARATNTYHVDVKLNNGTTRTFAYANPPAFATGARIEVKGDQLVARG